ncbi:MAG TPA: DNA repair protein RecO [Thiobacillaceae bacterium]|nr:DNA repair protein RecO [Thiobacillaceae bacterium]
MSERIDHQPGFILHARPWRETSLIVEVFTAGHGRLGLVARGARRPQSSLKARLLPFQPMALSWFGKGGLRTLHDAEWLGGQPMPQGTALMCGFYLNELLLRLLPTDDPHEVLYDLYQSTLLALAGGPVGDAAVDPQPALRRFELGLLSELGYAQTLDRLADGEAVRPEGRYRYVFGEGVLPAEAGTPHYSGGMLLDMAAGRWDNPETRSEAKQFMRALIQHYLNDKPLLTRQLLRDLHAL